MDKTSPVADTVAELRDVGSARTVAHVPPSSESLPEIEVRAVGPIDGARYLDRRLLGEGGMGEVRLVKDRFIGREVALKTLKGPSRGPALHRFLREAQVQAQLEHPAVVPVYDLGTEDMGSDGERRFFTMKRVRGHSLEEVIVGLAKGDAESAAAFPQRRLLNAFVQICLAIEYAHTRGVLHRDLKPANVMLGDFGEVHVLDWGLARVRGVADEDDESTEDRKSLEVAASSAGAGQTVDGQLLGTPGYMAPEQARGELHKLDARTDIYALGAILFEILFLEPLHGQPTAMARLTQTVVGPNPPILERARASEVAPELRALVERATALEAGGRFSSARALAEAVEAYLDGERDAHRRLELCEEHMLAAKRHRDAGALPEALRELGRAIALVPTHTAALVALHQLMTELPSEAPPEAQGELAALRASHALGSARTSTIRLLTWLLAVPLVIAFGVTDWTRGAMVLGALLSATAISALAWRGERVSEPWSLALGISSSIALATFSFLLGPFIVVPGLASTNAMFFAMTTDKKLRPAWLALGVLAIAVPFLLGLMGIDPHYTVENDALVVRSSLGPLPLEGTLLFLLLTSLATVITPTVLAGRMRDRLARAEEKVFLQAWHLRHLLPKT